MMGMDAELTQNWEWAMGGWYLFGQQSMTLTTPGGPVAMEVMMMFAPNGDGTYGGYYLDNMGEHHPMGAAETGDGGLIISWTDDVGTQRATIGGNQGGVVSATFELQGEDGSWGPSGTMTYTKVAAE